MPLEQIIRPFQRPDRLSTGRIVTARNATPPASDVVFEFGAAGAMPTPTIETSVGFRVINCNNTFTEKSRKTSNRQVQDQNNPDNKITVQDIDQITFSRADPPASEISDAFKSFANEVSSAINSGWGDLATVNVCDENYKLKNPA